MKSTFSAKGMTVIFAVVLSCVFLSITVMSASAEEKSRKPKTLLELLLRNKTTKVEKKKPRVRERRTTKRNTDTKPEIPDKVDAARTILVFGDFTAGYLASGLEKAFETSPGIVVEGKTKGSSGLVRQDYYDWTIEFPKLLEELKPAVAVISIGGNDRQEMDIDYNEYKFRTPEWIERYEARIDTITSLAKQHNVPLLWAGLPSFRSSSFSADMVILNSMYRKGAEKAGATYVDIWDGFVDEEGKFIYTGSDIDGQQVRLRTSDGLGFTKAGKRKQAYYVERFIRRLLGDATSENFTGIPASDLPELQFLPPVNNPELVRTDPIAITDPSFDGSDALLGGPKPQLAATSPLKRLLEDGYTGPETEGRADYYKPETASASEK